LLDLNGNCKLSSFFRIEDITQNRDPMDNFKDIEYYVPETFCSSIFKFVDNRRHYSIDHWSLGIVMYKCLTGKFPFLYSKSIVDDEIPNLNELDISNEAKQIISGLLNKNRDERLNLSQIKVHEFFKDIDWLKLEKGEIEPPFKPTVVI
jgi:serine/threonine protein kinase